MIKAQYIEFKGKKYPLALTIDVAERYLLETNEDFSATIINGVGTTSESIHQYKLKMILMLAYMIEEGAILTYPNWRIKFNKLFYHSYSGVSQSKVIEIYRFCSNDFIEAVLKYLFVPKKVIESSEETESSSEKKT